MSEGYAAEEFRKATNALGDARTMHASDVTDEAVVSRCYYACFHAANAALYDRGHEPNTHKGTISLFGQESCWMVHSHAKRDDFSIGSATSVSRPITGTMRSMRT